MTSGARARASPQLYARTIGVLYLIVIIVGFFAYGYVPGRLVAPDAAVTTHNILSHALLWRVGVVAGFVVVVCGVPQLLCEYLLLRPVQRNVALLAVLFNMISLVIESLSGLGHLAALSLAGQEALKGASAHELQAWAAFAIDLHDADLNISFLFFGCVCLLYGYLIFRSRFLPRFLGVLMVLAGLCYGANSLLVFLDLHVLPAAGVPLLLLPAGLSELILCLWLLVMGVDVPKWHRWSTEAAPDPMPQMR
ncbi:MAG TPA: DUF4386 domain-containing protein [Steroidobacteraceae bacterium]|nr:DUF4386 domain-containing protein [Steroidobacteraceae bacterium]